MKNRPAESITAAGAAALVVGYFAGVDDPGVVVALGVLIGMLPAGVTWLVELRRRRG